MDIGKRRADVFLRVAFATRYGHCSYAEAMDMPSSDLTDYCDALNTLLGQEHGALSMLEQ